LPSRTSSAPRFHPRLGAFGVELLRLSIFIDGGIECRARFRRVPGGGEAGQRRHGLHPHRSHGVRQQREAEGRPRLGRERLECFGRRAPDERVGVGRGAGQRR
jgi:hypothetical protein